MKNHIVLLLFVSLLGLNCYAQHPANFIPNSSFELYSGTISPFTSCKRPVDIDHNDVYNWRAGWSGESNTPEWNSFQLDRGNKNCFPCLNTSLNPFLDDKYIFIGKDEGSPFGESLFTEMIWGLQKDKKYKFRILAVGRPSDFFNIHLSKIGLGWNSPGNANDNMMNAIQFTVPLLSPELELCKVRAYESVITATKDNLYHIIIHATGNNFDNYSSMHLDRVELYEYCTESIKRQGRIYRYESELEEATNIIAGGKIDNIHLGDVQMLAGSITTYKAGSEVKLVEGFNVDRGADFTAKIAQCGNECPSSNLDIPTEYVICDNECITLNGGVSRGITYNWSSPHPAFMEYLSAVNTPNPIFCPPANGNGTYVYTVTTTNACGESTTKNVYIHYDPTSNDIPEFDVVNSNLSSLPDNPTLTIKTGLHTEYLSVEVLDCSGNILHTSIYKNGIDFTNPGPINWSLTNFTTPCGCYKIRITSKNYCYVDVKEEVYDWNRILSVSNVFASNVAICRDGKRFICFSGNGVSKIEFHLFLRDLHTEVMNKTMDFTSNPFCIEVDYDLINAEYFMRVSFIGCDGSVQTRETWVHVPFCGDAFISYIDTASWNGDTYNLGGIYQDAETGVLDSLHSTISPNPVVDYSVINYRIPKSGAVKISLLNSNFETQSVLLNQTNVSVGNYVLDFSNANLLNGINYYMIELYNEQNARFIKRFTVIK